jgi:peptide/nickel transport system permease protein
VTTLALDQPAARSPARETFARLVRNRSFVIGAIVVATIVLIAILAPLLAPYDPLRNNFRTRLQAPSAAFWFGTDHFGRDILSRVIYGARISLQIGAAVVIVTGIFGTLIGALAGFFRSLDNPIMRLMDALMAFPGILLAMAIAAVMGASVTNVVIALSIATTPHTARIVRGSVLVVREMEFVEAARALGASELRILFRHVLVNVMGPLIVRLTYVFAIAILAEAALSYIGVGPPPPAPSFGNIIANGRDFMIGSPWITIFPGLAIMVSVLGLNLLGDGLRDVLDPRMRS